MRRGTAVLARVKLWAPLRGALARLSKRPPQPSTSAESMACVYAVALGLLTWVDALASGSWLSVAPVWIAGLALSLGALAGLAAQVVTSAAARLPWVVSGVVWWSCGAGAGLWLVAELGSLAKLEGAHAGLARASLAGAALLMPLGLALGLALQQSVAGARLLLARRDYFVWALRAISLVAFGGAVWLDRNVLVALYPAMHLVLRVIAVIAWLALMTPLATFPGRRRAYRRGLVAVALLGGGTWLAPLVSEKQLTQLIEAPLAGLVFEGLRAGTDVDFDGYSALLGGGDCAAFDGDVYPGAKEVPNNGLDDNCALGDAVLTPLSKPEDVPIPSSPAPTSVVLITVDTLRADRMGVYGHDRNTTPNVDALAREALVFDRAFSSGGWTSIALPSMLHGLYPRRLKWTRLAETSRFRLVRAPYEKNLRKNEGVRGVFTMPLDNEHKTLPWWLGRRGMYTVAVVDDGHSQFLSPAFGCNKGFHRYHVLSQSASRRGDVATAAQAIQELERVPAGRPFFLWVHFFGPHDPTTKHAGIQSFGGKAIDRYDHEVRAVDTAIGRLLDAVQGMREERTIAVFLTADHGEWFKGKGSRQHGLVIPDIIHVPLIVQAEGWPRGRHAGPVSLVDIMPSILALTETPAPSGLDGLVLRDWIEGKRQRPFVFAETWILDRKGKVTYDAVAAVDGEHSFQINLKKNARSLFRVAPRTPRNENLLDQMPHQRHRDALGVFLEANSELKISD